MGVKLSWVCWVGAVQVWEEGETGDSREVWYGLVWYGVVRYGRVRYGMVWYGRVTGARNPI